MAKDNKSVFEIFIEGVGIYGKHLPIFFKYMSFPIWGQFIGVILSLALPFWFANTFSAVIGDANLAYTLTLVLCIPGLIIFTKAFWEYLVAYVAINSMTENTVKSGRIYDIKAHKKVATMSKRVGEFVVLWLLFGLFSLIGILPPVWVFAIIIFVYIVLIFQVFTFEKTLTPWECFIRSKDLIKSNFWRTVGLMILVGGLTYFVLPKIVTMIFEVLRLSVLLNSVLDPILLSALPFEQWNATLAALNTPYVITSLEVTKTIVSTVISTLVIFYTLPLRSICYTLWYKQLSIKEIKAKSKSKKAKSDNV